MGLREIYNLVISARETIIMLAVILAVLALIIIILIVIEKKLRKKIKLQKNNRNLSYLKKLKNLTKSKSKPEETLESINKIARDFFKEAFNLPYNLEYSELIEQFRKSGKKECISFCRLMLTLSYSGEKIEKEKIRALTELLNKIIRQNRIISEEEKSSKLKNIRKR